MKRTGILFPMLVLAGALFVAGLGAEVTWKPSLRLLGTNPLAVRGFHFRPGEHVRVTATLQGMKLRRDTRANAAGTFTVRFSTAPLYDPCGSSLVVAAVGSLGSMTLLKPPPRECAPIRPPP